MDSSAVYRVMPREMVEPRESGHDGVNRGRICAPMATGSSKPTRTNPRPHLWPSYCKVRALVYSLDVDPDRSFERYDEFFPAVRSAASPGLKLIGAAILSAALWDDCRHRLIPCTRSAHDPIDRESVLCPSRPSGRRDGPAVDSPIKVAWTMEKPVRRLLSGFAIATMT